MPRYRPAAMPTGSCQPAFARCAPSAGRRQDSPRACRRLVRCLALLAVAGEISLLIGGTPSRALGSALLAPAVGAADGALAGTRIADPPTPSAALFSNAAGLAAFETTTVTSSLGLGFGRSSIRASQPPGYRDSNTVVTGIPDVGVVLPLGWWRFAAGAYGSTGSQFVADADPARRVGRFVSETIIAAFPLAIAYRASDRVSVGAEVQPLFGQLRTRFPVLGLDFRSKVNGPGLQGMVGIAARPANSAAVGLAVRSPGAVWMRGRMPLPGGPRQDVALDVKMPTQVFLGATWQALPRLALSASVRYTAASSLGRSILRFERTPQLDSSFVPDAKDEWKFALAAEYAFHTGLVARLGLSRASRIVGTRGVNPLVFDGEDTKLAAGIGRTWGRWTVDATAGYNFATTRNIPAEAALLLPGRYAMQGAIVLLGVTHRR